jgi:hypothetical protein
MPYHGPVLAGTGVLLKLVMLLASPLEIGGDCDCPSPEAIASRVAALAPAVDSARPPTFVEVSRAGGNVRLELRGGDGKVLASRVIEGAAGCEDLAAAAAVVIATWQNDLDPKAALGVDLPPTAPPEPPTPTLVASAPPLRPRPAMVGVGILASAADAHLAPGATVRASVDFERFGLGATLGATPPRTIDVGALPNAATWTRGWLGAGPELHSGAATRVEGHLHGLAGLLRVAGAEVPEPASDTKLDLGVGVGLGVSRWVGNAAVWFGVDLLAWPGRQQLIIQGLQDRGRLPTFDLQLAAGLALGRGR